MSLASEIPLSRRSQLFLSSLGISSASTGQASNFFADAGFSEEPYRTCTWLV